MIRYNQTIKDVSIGYNKEELLKMGEFDMIKAKEGQGYIYDEYNGLDTEFERTFKLYETSNLLSKLSDFIDLKSSQLKENLEKIEEFSKRSQWLASWNENTKNDILLQASSSLLSLDNDKLDKLQKRIYRYEKYFDLMEEEKDVLKKYEYTFNFLTQIPSQINLYVEEANNKHEKFEAKQNIYRDLKENTSSSEDVFYFPEDYDFEIAA